jgi:N utilization substance protein A
VRQVVNELRGEKIDIVPFHEDLQEFVTRALSPAKVTEVRPDEMTGDCDVIVPDFQLSLAIGKEGQNARLASRLTGWGINIKSETQFAEEQAYAEGVEWADGEWIQDPETGENLWQPADGSDPISEADYLAMQEEEAAAADEAPVTDDEYAEDEAGDGPVAEADDDSAADDEAE